MRSKLDVGPMQFVQSLLATNELLEEATRGSDRNLEDAIKAEFPDRQSLIISIGLGISSIAAYRTRFNWGTLVRPTNPVRPDRLSLRYNEFGIAVDFRTGRLNLGVDSLMELWDKYQPKETLEELLSRQGIDDASRAITHYRKKQAATKNKRW